MLSYGSESNTLLGNLTFEPASGIELGLDAVWSAADASLEAFDFDVPAEFLAANPNMSYDFTQTHTNSDLDLSRIELGVSGRFELTERLALTGGYRYLDLDDDAPYRGDVSGSAELYRLGAAWTF